MYTVSSNYDEARQQESDAKRPRGRPRSVELRQRILAAASRLAAEAGGAVGFDRIAQAAGASRTTLYRWWTSPQELLLDALLEEVRSTIHIDDGVPVIAQLRSHIRMTATVLMDPPTGAPLRALASAALTRPDVHTAFVEHWFEPRREAARRLLERGIAEGVVVDEDPEVLIDVLFGPVYHRAFFTDGPLDDAFVDGLIRRVSA